MPTSRPILALGHIEPLSHPPQDTTPLTSRPTPALGHPSPHSQPYQEQAPPTSRPKLALGPPAPKPPILVGSAHQWANTSPRTPWGSTDSCLMTQPHLLAASSHHKKTAWQPTRQGASHAYQTTHSSQPTTTEGPTQPTLGATLVHIALETRGEYATEKHRTSPKKGHFYKARKCNQPAKYMEIK